MCILCVHVYMQRCVCVCASHMCDNIASMYKRANKKHGINMLRCKMCRILLTIWLMETVRFKVALYMYVVILAQEFEKIL